MSTRAPSKAAIAAALAFALSVFAFTLFVWKSFGGGTPLQPEGYRVVASFGAGGTQLFPNADVRIAGVKVGKVKAVEPAGLRTRAELQIEPRFAPLRADVRAVLRTKTLLGETFVSLTPGSRDARELREGEALARTQVEEPQAVDEVLATFDAPTREAFRDVLEGLSGALEGRGEGLNATLGNAALATEDLRGLVEVLERRDRELRGLVRDGGATLRAVGDRPAELRRLVRAAETVLGTTAARGAQLEATVRELPATLREARATLREADGAAGDAAPVLRALRPVAPLVRPGLLEAEGLAPELAGLATDLRPVLSRARRGLPAVTRVLRAAQPLLGTLDTAGRDLVPVVETLEAYAPDVVGGLANLAAASNATADGQRLLRVLFLLFNESFVGYGEKLGSSRSNAYPKPGAILDMIGRGMASMDCSTAGNPQVVPVIGAGTLPCREQGPWTLRGRTALLPKPQRDP